MGELGLNKVIGALLATALGIFGLQEIAAITFSDGAGHHGAHEPDSLNEWCAETFHYCTEIAETGGGSEAAEEVFDLGLLLANADLSRGERSMKGKCASCHTWNEGGNNGTGPNLYATVGRDIAGVEGFGYTGVFTAYPGNWTYEELNGFLLKPSRHIPGTGMSFNGLSKDGERADVIAFLASLTPNAPAFPDPLPAVEEAGEAIVEGAVDAAGDEVIEAIADEAAVDGVEEVVVEVIEPLTEVVESTAEAVEDAAEGVIGEDVE